MSSLWLDRPTAIETDSLGSGSFGPDSSIPDVAFDEVIVGAGITGLVSALLFAREGRKVAVLEARTVGAVTTGNSTAKVSQLQGTQLSQVSSSGTRGVLQAYADGNRAAFDWLLEYTASRGVPLERRHAYTYAGTAVGVERVEREYAIARTVGLDVRRVHDVGLPFVTYGAVMLPDQAQLNPVELLAALAVDFRALGGVIYEQTRVLTVRASSPVRVETSRGVVRAGHVILATGTPILDRGLYFAKVSAHRSYAQAFEVADGSLPDGMFLSAETPTRSIRTAGGLLLTGGNGHPVGREPSPQRRVDELTAWTQQRWPGARRTHAWSAQDYSTPHHVPFVGWLPRGRGRIFLATGFDKWGMTNGVATALTLVADILGANTAWQTTLHHRPTLPRAFGIGIGENAAVASWYARGYFRALRRHLPDVPPAEGRADVGRRGTGLAGLRPTAVSTVHGTTCELSAVCSHLGAVVTWNDAELSWDCPAHGSRFAADGTRLEGPATRDLRRTAPR
jgi:glycine/D-amino acid oxidase-like deaminating enzyme/nitrite reductase/ring-hydroxylating ferredoxin subunit